MSTRWSGVRLFGFVLGGYLALILVGLVLMVGGGLGPDVEATASSRIGSVLLGVLFFPLPFVHRRFFLGRPLPGSDWFWIIGVGATWAGGVTGARALVRRVRRG